MSSYLNYTLIMYLMNYPEIRIGYAWLLSDNVSEPLNKLWGDGTPLQDHTYYEKVAENYKEAWRPYEERIIKGMCELLGLSFRQNIIDVHVTPWMHAFSSPMVIGVIYKPNRFVEILAHEICHRLLTDNNETPYDTNYVEEWQKLFGKQHDWNVLVHVPVHAMLQAIFDDILHEPKRTANDKKLCEQWESYDRAWRYVDEVGYKRVIEQLRESYKKLSGTR